MSFCQAYLTQQERDEAALAYIKRGAKVKKDGQRALIVQRTRWEDERVYKSKKKVG